MMTFLDLSLYILTFPDEYLVHGFYFLIPIRILLTFKGYRIEIGISVKQDRHPKIFVERVKSIFWWLHRSVLIESDRQCEPTLLTRYLNIYLLFSYSMFDFNIDKNSIMGIL